MSAAAVEGRHGAAIRTEVRSFDVGEHLHKLSSAADHESAVAAVGEGDKAVGVRELVGPSASDVASCDDDAPEGLEGIKGRVRIGCKGGRSLGLTMHLKDLGRVLFPPTSMM